MGEEAKKDQHAGRDLKRVVAELLKSLPKREVLAVFVTVDGCRRTEMLGPRGVDEIPQWLRLPITRPFDRHQDCASIAEPFLACRVYRLESIKETPEGGVVAEYREQA